jgi:hypothetical protein
LPCRAPPPGASQKNKSDVIFTKPQQILTMRAGSSNRWPTPVVSCLNAR